MTVIDYKEARRNGRQRVIEVALIRFGDKSVCCAVRNFSETGAALDIGAHTVIPDQFTLITIAPTKRIYSCNVVWRKERRVGVSFL